MTVDRVGMLSPVFLDLEIIQEYSGRERIVLGTLDLNLAEYVGRERENRRYLMKASKINSTLQISTELKQISGEASFKVPELKPAQVFSGIAGVMMSEPQAPEAVDTNPNQGTEPPSYSAELPSIPSHSRERLRIQDIYRKSLAASWQLQAGELNAVDCIEDIFSGGDGWAADWGQLNGSGPAALRPQGIPDEGETNAGIHDSQYRNHRPSISRPIIWQPSTDSLQKKTRIYPIFDRQTIDITSNGSTPTHITRSGSQNIHKLNTLRPSISSTKSLPLNRYSNTTLPQTSHSLADSINSTLDRGTHSSLSHPHSWQPPEIAEEELRENLISWSL